MVFPKGATPERVAELSAGIHAYINRVFMDMPEPPEESGSRTAYTSFVATYIDIFASQYDWSAVSDKPVIDSPLAQLFQLLREIEDRLDAGTARINPRSDAIKDKFLSETPPITREQMDQIKREALANLPQI